jgi:transposase
MKRYTFTLEETQEIKAAREKNRDKNVEKRLAALEMRAEGKQNKEIREKTGFHTQYINKLHIPENIELFYIPPYTPEMNPIEQIWKELRITGFRNEVFATLEKVVDRLCDTICTLTSDTIRSITRRSWTIDCFN